MAQLTLGYFLGLDDEPCNAELDKHTRKKEIDRYELLRYIRPLIMEALRWGKRSDEAIFRHLASYGIKYRKNIEYFLQNLLMVEIIKETKDGEYRFFERVRR